MARVLVAGATGYIGKVAARELARRGHAVVCVARRAGDGAETRRALAGAEVRFADVLDPAALRRDAVCGERFDAVVSCLGSRTGAPRDAWRVEHDANANLLAALREAGARHFVLLSAICVQRPRLAFQHAKLAFERALVASGVSFSIVRPTAFMKSLAGQVERVKRGAPFLVFGDGELTACKPISQADLARYLADCLEDPARRDAILPVGGPGPAITPRGQAELLGELLGRPVRLRRVPVHVLGVVGGALRVAGALVPRLRDKAELVRIGRYYATESMLVFDEAAQAYSAERTPEFGRETLRDFYTRVLEQGLAGQELGDHALFS